MPKKKKSKNDPTRRFGGLLENIDSKLDAVFERQKGLENQISGAENSMASNRQEIDYKFEVVLDELHLIRNDLKEKIGRDEFTVLEKRVAHLEKKIARS